MSPFFLLAGAVLGCVMAVPLVGATVWVVQVTIGRGFRSGVGAAIALAGAQWVPAGGGAFVVLGLARVPDVVHPFARFAAAAMLLLLARSVLMGPGVDQLRYDGPWLTARTIMQETWRRAWRLRWRMAAYAAQFTAVSLHWRPHGFVTAPLLAFGVVAGAFAWWIFFVILAWLFGTRVSEPVCLRSLNKLRFLGSLTLAGLALISVVALLF